MTDQGSNDEAQPSAIQTAETGNVTLEAALSKLRARYPDLYVSAQRKDGVWCDPTTGDRSEYHYYHLLAGGKGWRKPTLEEALTLALADGQETNTAASAGTTDQG